MIETIGLEERFEDQGRQRVDGRSEQGVVEDRVEQLLMVKQYAKAWKDTYKMQWASVKLEEIGEPEGNPIFQNMKERVETGKQEGTMSLKEMATEY